MRTDGQPRRLRLDLLLLRRGLAASRSKAQALVMAGRVFSRGRRLAKPGALVSTDAPLEVVAAPRWVSRGGAKLEGALRAFGIGVRGRLALDVGASTGGFTQVLLAAGALGVAAVDVGRGQIDWTLRGDPRVVLLEGVNARYLDPSRLPFRPSLAVIDVSFISLEKILPRVLSCLEPGGEALALVKPQFEVGRGRVGRGGVVRDPGLHREVLQRLGAFLREHGAGLLGLARSPLPGAEGNVEFFVRVVPGPGGLSAAELDRAIEDVLRAGGPGARP